MIKLPKNYDKDLELHESEWGEDGKTQPFLGSGAFWFFRVTLPTIVVTIIFGLVWKQIVIGLLG